MANTTADKLQGILNSKEAIRQAIVAKGQSCPTTTPLANYASKINAISTGSAFYKCASLLGDAYITEIEHGSTKFYRASGLDYDSKYAWCDGSTVFFSVNDSLAAGDELWTYTGGAWVRDSGSVASTGTEATPVQRWVGYKAVLSQGVYSFESTLTTDSLTCTSVTPVVNGIYTADALCTVGSLYVGLPADGLILYLPLSSAQSTAATGQDLTTVGSPSFATESGIASCYFNGSSYIQFPVSVNMSSPFTISWWLKRTYDRDRDIFGFSSNEFSSINGYVYSMRSNAVRSWIGAAMDWNVNNNWNNLIETYDGSTLKTYVNGTLQDSTAYTMQSSAITSGRVGAASSSSYKFVGYMAGFRLYNRCITQEEITALAGEFTPTDV